MTSHLLVMPILLPMLFGSFLLILGNRFLRWQRLLTALAMLFQLIVALLLFQLSSSENLVTYALGNWQPPFGIVLVLDRLAAYMILITILLGSAALLYASDGQDRFGSNFHALFQFQLMGICGAFLTGDIFNLFVFFEILLIASYALILHSGTPKRTLVALHYVILNVAASCFFLIAVGILYGTLGTLNMADLAIQVSQLDPRRLGLVESAALMLMAVFLLKTAIFPLHFWLARTYAAAPGSVAAIFAIMTKVGIYALIRIYILIFGPSSGVLANLVLPWLWWSGLITVLLASVGIFASYDLRTQISYLTLISVGTLVATLGMGHPDSLSATLFYLPHTTFLTAGLFLLAEVIANQRGRAGTRIVRSRQLRQPYLLGALFLLASLGILGIPPFSGSVSKAWLLFTAEGQQRYWLWPIVLLSTLVALISLSRAGTIIFWNVSQTSHFKGIPLTWRTGLAIGFLISSTVIIPLFSNPLSALSEQISSQLLNTKLYTQTIMPTSLSTAQPMAIR